AFMSVIGALGYLVVTSAIDQISALSKQVSGLITARPGATAPIVTRLEKLGLSQSQIQSASDQLLAQTQVVAASVVPFLEGFFSGMLDAVLVTVLSIYLLVDGERVIQWVRQSAPVKHRPRVTFAVLTLQRVVGGYIRGQLILCTLIGTLVGVGMGLLGVPYAVLLGVLAFILEFIPVIGVLVSGAACVLMALTQSWLLALFVLAYFIFVHVIEGDVVGPRVVGKAVGVHPAVSIVALVAGAELFGIWGALFASPIAGLAQAILSEAWQEWRELHAGQFPKQFGAPAVPVTTADATVHVTTTTTVQRRARPGESGAGQSGAGEEDDGATTVADPFEQTPLPTR
ncbi:MAG TPA: AI-2E family transporter, partial [Ktedonobacterales bacterium]|nr:AI-2E family transporter [Ktedonobacterales bacterium]